jgi:hypothetical protein
MDGVLEGCRLHEFFNEERTRVEAMAIVCGDIVVHRRVERACWETQWELQKEMIAKLEHTKNT